MTARVPVGAVIVCSRPDDRPELAARSLLEQSPAPAEIVALCDASAPGVAERLHAELGGRVDVLSARGPLEGARGRNLGVQLTDADAVLLMEPGVVLQPDYLARAAAVFDDRRAGLAGGLLERPGPPASPPVAADAYLARSRRPLDAPPAAVGPSLEVLSLPLEAGLYRREMLADVADESGPFDEALTPRLAALELGWRAWRGGWSARVVTSARASVAHAAPEPAGAEPRLAAVLGRHLMMLRHDRPAALLPDAPWWAAAELRELLSLLAAGPGRLAHLLRAGTVARRRARERRRADASRRGAWGPWRRDVPPRGVWREAPPRPSVSEEAPR